MATVLVRGVRNDGGAEATLLAASLALVGFALLGFVLGSLAAWIVEDSVRSRVAAELAELESRAEQDGPKTA